jgi:hypothetical protein
MLFLYRRTHVYISFLKIHIKLHINTVRALFMERISRIFYILLWQKFHEYSIFYYSFPARILYIFIDLLLDKFKIHNEK